jgi:hypothetical protein
VDEPLVMACDVTTDGSAFKIKPIAHPQIRLRVNKEVTTFENKPCITDIAFVIYLWISYKTFKVTQNKRSCIEIINRSQF